MITAAPHHPFHSSRRAIVASTRRMALAMGVDLHGRRAPGLTGSITIVAVIAVLTGGLVWGALDSLVGWVIPMIMR